MQIQAKDKIILPLDVSSPAEAHRLLQLLGDSVGYYKVGLQLFTACGPEILRAIRGEGAKIFLDLKLHDIPNTVRHAVESALAHDVEMLTIHASGGLEMARAAVQGAAGSPLLLLGVTVLTSSTAETLTATGVQDGVENQVRRLAGIAAEAGLGGVVASPHEIAMLRNTFGTLLKIVTPGVRPSWAEANDQKRILTPAEAVTLGADYLVIGRPITAAKSPREALLRILEEIQDVA